MMGGGVAWFTMVTVWWIARFIRLMLMVTSNRLPGCDLMMPASNRSARAFTCASSTARWGPWLPWCRGQSLTIGDGEERGRFFCLVTGQIGSSAATHRIAVPIRNLSTILLRRKSFRWESDFFLIGGVSTWPRVERTISASGRGKRVGVTGELGGCSEAGIGSGMVV